MAILDATNSEITFSSTTAFASAVSGNDSSYTWTSTDPGNQITAFGTGFTYLGALALSGTVTSISLDFVNSTHPAGTVDATITGISVPINQIQDPFNPASGEISFWATIFGGNDTIYAPRAAGGRLSGDFLSVVSTAFNEVSLTGGNDTLYASGGPSGGLTLSRGGTGSPNALVGDALYANGVVSAGFLFAGFVTGGDDQFFVSKKSAFTVVGDVQFVDVYGEAVGGKDTVTSTIDIISATTIGSSGIYSGDVEDNLGWVQGGADTIKGSNFAFAIEFIIGDVIESGDIGAAATTVGGNDTLIGRAGQDFMAGDVYRMQAGTMTGGNDNINGGEDSDVISGDALQSIGIRFGSTTLGGTPHQVFTTITLTGGNDTLAGGNGNDWIVGDLWNGDGVEEPSTIVGGNDIILGGAGDDMLYGDIGADYVALLDAGGDDVIDGGMGDDIIDGQLGNDTASFASLALAVTVDLAAGTATGQGNDILAGIENITGSSKGDVLSGDAGDNVINGGAGADTLNGRDGSDTLSDGTGSDTLNGNAGVDTFILAADGTADVFNGGGDADVLNLSAATSNVTVTFSGQLGNGAISGGGFGADTFTSVDSVVGSDNAGLVDTVVGAGGTQVMYLRSGNDIGLGMGGNDAIAGEGGKDRLDGGTGEDTLNGGNGADTFVFSTTLDAASNVDKIEDFDTSADMMELSSSVFAGLAPGSLAGSAFVKGAGVVTAQDTSDRIIYDTSTGELYFDADGTDSAFMAVRFAVLANMTSTLNAGDFVIV